ncbi:MAG TPA: WD40 repeat domain-containing protein, partial [Gemmataceae bacterium]
PSPGMGLSVDGSLFASSHYLPPPRRGRRYDHFVLVRDATTGKIHATFHDCTHSVSDLAFSPCGDILAGVAGPSLHIWNLATKRQVGVKKLGKLHFQALAFTPDGRFLGTASNDETARFWDTRTWEVATTFTWKIGRMLDIAFAPDGLRAAASGSSGKVVVWDVDI